MGKTERGWDFCIYMHIYYIRIFKLINENRKRLQERPVWVRLKEVASSAPPSPLSGNQEILSIIEKL